MPRIAERRNWKPGPFAQVDWSNPMSTGLRGYGCAYDEWAHIGRRQYPTEFPDSDIVRASGPWGPGLLSNNLDDEVVAYRVLGTHGVESTMMTWVMPEDSTSRGVAIGITDRSTQGLRIGIGGGGGLSGDGNGLVGDDGPYVKTSSLTIGDGFHSLAVAYREGASGSEWYVDAQIGPYSITKEVDTMSPWFMEIAGTANNSFYEWLGISGPWAIWERKLTTSEIAKMHADPFQMLRR